MKASTIMTVNGRWEVNGKKFNEMYEYEKFQLNDFIAEIKAKQLNTQIKNDTI
ncbi:hypothetical protein [Joostella sp.]|uniref:hypothetical protein n=1 Tax=Joostella sp. TaxID=2231138 RepID=UPI003A90F337